MATDLQLKGFLKLILFYADLYITNIFASENAFTMIVRADHPML
jgi:hypothetical protein